MTRAEDLQRARRLAEARTRVAVEYVASRVVREGFWGVEWEPDPNDPYLAERTPPDLAWRLALKRRRRAR